MKKTIKTVAQRHEEWVRNRFLKERLEVLGHLTSRHHGLSKDEILAMMAARREAELVVHVAAGAEGGNPTASVQLVDVEPGPNVVKTIPLHEVMDAYGLQRDLLRARRLDEIDTRAPLAHFDGSPISESAADRHARVTREAVFEDAKVLPQIREHGLPILRPPSPSANGKVSMTSLEEYAAAKAEIDEVLDREAVRLRALRKVRMEEAATRAPAYAKEQLGHVLSTLPVAARAEVEQAIAGPAAAQGNLYLISRPILTADGKQSVGFSTRRFDTERGGRPTAEGLARDFGQPDARGIRVASIAELMADARERLQQVAVYGENSCAVLPEHRRGLFVTAADTAE